MRSAIGLAAVCAALVGCATAPPPPSWAPVNEQTEAEYQRYLGRGTATVQGQAFMATAGGGVVKGAGRVVTLDPATTTGTNWWGEAGIHWAYRDVVPPSPSFLKARRETVADADGRFRFTQLPPGRYYVRTTVTWEVGNYVPTQGGLVGQLVEVGPDESRDVILNAFPR